MCLCHFLLWVSTFKPVWMHRLSQLTVYSSRQRQVSSHFFCRPRLVVATDFASSCECGRVLMLASSKWRVGSALFSGGVSQSKPVLEAVCLSRSSSRAVYSPATSRTIERVRCSTSGNAQIRLDHTECLVRHTERRENNESREGDQVRAV